MFQINVYISFQCLLIQMQSNHNSNKTCKTTPSLSILNVNDCILHQYSSIIGEKTLHEPNYSGTGGHCQDMKNVSVTGASHLWGFKNTEFEWQLREKGFCGGGNKQSRPLTRVSVRRVSTVHQSLVVCRGKAVPSSLSQVLVLPPWGSNPGGFHSADQCSTNLTNITV